MARIIACFYILLGLTSLVPDQLLTVFDENELELVMCGSSNISVEDMKAYSNTTAFNEHVSGLTVRLNCLILLLTYSC